MGNGSAGTALGHGLGGPKATVKPLYLARLDGNFFFKKKGGLFLGVY